MSLSYILPRLPVLLVQGLRLRKRALRLPEADGPRHGQIGQGPALRLLIIGDSSAAGVGAMHQDNALTGRLAAHLAPHVALNWRLCAQSGATVGSAQGLLDALPRQHFDIALAVLGVNDAKNGNSRRRWQMGYAALADRLVTDFGVNAVLATGVPPLDQFPLLPQPLRRALGLRAQLLDQALAELAEQRPELSHLPMDFPPEPSLLARDGFHPSPRLYDEWAAEIAIEILTRIDSAVE